MTWKTDVQKVIFDASQGAKSLSSNLSNYFESLVNSASTTVGSLLRGSSVIGINANEIPNMRSAIREYVKNLEAHLEKVVTDADTSGAFKGEYASAVTVYVSAIAEACKCVTSQLLAFSDQLKEVSDAYQAQDREMSQRIKDTAASTADQFTKYQEKY
ncbi:MAG: hypothetical protein ACM3O4_05950 [Ignavibacteriales bacterium]